MVDTKNNLTNLCLNKKMIICCGSGGVGKTTVSATLGILAASLGKNVMVITIDPAKRLATSLGIDSLNNEPTELTEKINKKLKAYGKPMLAGKISAIMPEAEKTFERFIKSVAKDQVSTGKKILGTSIYKIFAQEFSGMNEYLAMEKLYELHNSGAYDLIILDTPPSANTVVFLEAPSRLLEFFDDRILKLFIEPGSKIFAFGLRKVLNLLERITGQGFIAELLEFTASLFELRSRFIENLTQVSKLLHNSENTFLMVTSAQRLSKTDTQLFTQRLEREKYPFWGFIVNRSVALAIGLPLENISNFIPKEISSDQTLLSSFEKIKPKLIAEKEAYDWLNKNNTSVKFLPDNSEDIHSIDSLLKLAESMK